MSENFSWIISSKDMGEVCPTFFKTFLLNKSVKKASISITTAGIYEAVLNGDRIGDFIFAPGCTSYENRLQYQQYDITDLLQQKNLIEVTVGKGWYRGRISEKCNEFHNAPCAVTAKIKIVYDDQSEGTICTDTTWSVKESQIRFSDIYDGESFDASFQNDTSYPVVLLDSIPTPHIILQQGDSIAEQEHLKPVKLIITPKGEKVLDFGQNLAGYISFQVFAKGGEHIRILHGEILDSDGNFYHENYRSAKAAIEYVCHPGLNCYHPHFCFFGFRYIKLEEYPFGLNENDFTSIAVYSKMQRTGFIETSNQKLNQLIRNTLWSMRSNFLDIPSDCPQRDERMGWLGDAQVFARTACYNYDTRTFFHKWLQDLCNSQFSNGAIPDTVPNFWKLTSSSSAWGDAITIIPWQLYLSYGDTDILKNCYPAMQKWVDYIAKDSLTPYLWTSKKEDKALWKKHYGDWLALDAPSGSYKGATDDDFVASAFYANSLNILIKTGHILHKNMEHYEAQYKDTIRTFKQTYSVLKTQTEHVLALYFQLTDEPLKVADELADMIQKNNNHLTTGFTGTPYLLHVLSRNGHVKTAYNLLLQEDYPSWLYEINHGATTIWEHWDGVKENGTFWSSDMNSFNHYAYGSVIDWFYSVMAGINPIPEHPGYEHVLICPVVDPRIHFVTASLKTNYGVIHSSWQIHDHQVRYEIQTPVQATIRIQNQTHQVTPGSYLFYSSISSINK